VKKCDSKDKEKNVNTKKKVNKQAVDKRKIRKKADKGV
jgi:hypothetical protein